MIRFIIYDQLPGKGLIAYNEIEILYFFLVSIINYSINYDIYTRLPAQQFQIEILISIIN